MKCARDRLRTSIVSGVEEEVKGDFGNFFVRDDFDFSVSLRYAAAICSRRKAVVKAGGAKRRHPEGLALTMRLTMGRQRRRAAHFVRAALAWKEVTKW